MQNPQQIDAKRSRPQTEASYGIPSDSEGMLSWDFVREQMSKARNYWISSVSPDGAPHAVPIWGVWLDDTLYFGGGASTRWMKNVFQNPSVVIHSESGSEVVILEGVAEQIHDPQQHIRIDDAYEVKYDMRHGTPVWGLQIKKALAWGEYPTTTTRWTF